MFNHPIPVRINCVVKWSMISTHSLKVCRQSTLIKLHVLTPFPFTSQMQELTDTLSLSYTQLVNSGTLSLHPSFPLPTQCVLASRNVTKMDMIMEPQLLHRRESKPFILIEVVYKKTKSREIQMIQSLLHVFNKFAKQPCFSYPLHVLSTVPVNAKYNQELVIQLSTSSSLNISSTF